MIDGGNSKAGSRRRPAWIGLLAAVCLAARAAGVFPPDDQAEFADGLLARGLHALAIREYRGFLQAYPEHAQTPRVLFHLGEAYRGAKNPSAADVFYQRVVREFPESGIRANAEYRRGELCLEAGRYAEAARLFEALAAREIPEDLQAAALYFLGQSQVKTGASAAAEETFRRLLKEQPESSAAVLAQLDLADLLRASARPDEARELYRSVARDADPAFVAEALFQQADLAFREEAYSEAAALYARLLQDFPDNPRAKEAQRAAAWAFHYDGRHAAVLELAERPHEGAAALQAEWLYLSANSRRFLLDTEGALAEYDRLVEREVESPYVQAAAYEGACLALQHGDFSGAIRRASAMALDGPREPDLHWILAEAYVGAGDTTRAIQYYRRLAERFPDHARAADAGFRLGKILQQREQWAEASTVFRRYAIRYPDHAQAPYAWLASGHARMKQGDWDGAVEEWTRLIETFPEHGAVEEALARRARGETHLARYESALETWRTLRRLYPESRFGVEAGYGMGVLYDRAGETQAAEKAFRRALSASPPPEWDRRIRYALAGIFQKTGRAAETAEWLQDLLSTPMRREMDPEVLEWLVRWQLDSKAEAAAAEAAQALQKHPGAAPDRRRRAGLLLGRAWAGQGKTEAAVRALEQALASGVQDREALEGQLLLGRLLADLSRWSEARQAFTTLVEEASDGETPALHAAGLYGLGDVAERSGDHEEAARFFMGMAILFDDPEQSPRALFRAVGCYEALGRIEEASAARHELSERYPYSAWLRRLRNGENP